MDDDIQIYYSGTEDMIIIESKIIVNENKRILFQHLTNKKSAKDLVRRLKKAIKNVNKKREE